MKPCFNTITTKFYSLEDDIRLCSKFGYSGIEIDSEKLDKYLETHDLNELNKLLGGAKLEVAGLMAFPFKPFSDATDTLSRIRKYAQISYDLRCPVILSYIAENKPADMDLDEAYQKASERVDVYANVVKQFNLNIAIEPLGGNNFIPGPEPALKIIKMATSSNIGITMDTFHFFKSGVSLNEISKIPVDKLLLVHINDVEDRPQNELEDKHRLYPGDGIMPLLDYFRILKNIGYSGFLSIELFREEYWQDSNENVIRAAKEGLDKILAQL